MFLLKFQTAVWSLLKSELHVFAKMKEKESINKVNFSIYPEWLLRLSFLINQIFIKLLSYLQCLIFESFLWI